jgi:glycosyltransferase involved in cell wall biosynthesis
VIDGKPMGPLRVLMVVRLFLPWVGGTEQQAHKLALHLIGWGVDVQIVTGRWFRSTPRRETIGGVDVFRNHTLWEFFGIKGMRKLGGYLYILTLIWHLWRKRRTYDIIHVHGLNYHTFAAVVAGRWLRRPTVTKLANSGEASDILKMRKGEQLALSRFMIRPALRCDRFVAVNRAIVDELVASGTPPRAIVQIPNGVEVGQRPKSTYKLHDPARLLFVGRLHGQKAVDVLLQSFQELRARRDGEGVSLTVVGEGPKRGELMALAEQLGVANSTQFLGNRKVDEFLQDADIFVMPSRAEGLSNAMLEAMSFGLPVVASEIPGNDDLIQHQHNGLLFSVDDPASLTGALIQLLNDASLREAMGRCARQTVEEHYSIDDIARRYVALYEQLMRRDQRQVLPAPATGG